MQVLIRNHSNFKFLLCCILILTGYTETYASAINNADIAINSIPNDNSDLKENQDLYFEDVSLKKNDLNINSETASIKDLNSGKTIFTFLGNVEIKSEIVSIKCDTAILEFEDKELKNAIFTGELSSFQQFDNKKELIASGAAEIFEYDHVTNILKMETNAWVNNGNNEVSGNLITYNLVKRSIIADSENGSPVKLIIDSDMIN